MTDDGGHWAALLQWVLGNPEKGALFLVILAGAWRWLRELRRDVVDDQQHESFTEILMRENKELRALPVSQAYRAGNVVHGPLLLNGRLEAQMASWIPGDKNSIAGSPDRVDALVLDLNLAGHMTGREVARIARDRGIAVLLVTGLPPEEIAAASRALAA